MNTNTNTEIIYLEIKNLSKQLIDLSKNEYANKFKINDKEVSLYEKYLIENVTFY
jgi:hypothetical protein